MFIDNKYTKVYFTIIDRARSEFRKKSKHSYFESHHVIPRSMGGNDGKDNLVLLTAKEHFICHLLLTKMCISRFHAEKMRHAFSCMANLGSGKQQRVVSRRYGFFVSPLSEESRRKLSEQKRGARNPNYDKPEAADRLLKYSVAMRGKKRSPEVTLAIKQNKLIRMCELLYLHYDEITDSIIKEAKGIGILANSYPRSVQKIIDGLGYLPAKGR
jgi:hypothetical protein